MKNTLKVLARVAAILFVVLTIFRIAQEILSIISPNKVSEYVPIYDDEPFDEDWDGVFYD